jgi:hypothetical protein
MPWVRIMAMSATLCGAEPSELWSYRAHVAANLLHYQATTNRDKLCPHQHSEPLKRECHNRFDGFMADALEAADQSDRITAAHVIESLEYELERLIERYALQVL